MTTPHVLTEADVTEAIRRVELGIKTIEQGVKRHGTTLPWDYRLPLDALAWAAGALSFVQAVLSRLAIAERAGPKWIDGPPTEPGAYWWCFHDGTGKPINGVMRISVVHEIGPRLMVAGGDGGLNPVSKPQRLWYGPFREPEVAG